MNGSAGIRGKSVRQDIYVEVEIRDAGGIELEIESRVAAYYEASLEEQARGAIESFGVAHARLFIEDKGALPFAVAARLQTALKRALPDAEAEVPLPEGAAAPPVSRRDRERRSRLYIPGNGPKLMVNAGLHGADGVILDLEDSVHPEEKDAARDLVRYALGCLDFSASERMVRVNPFPIGKEDLEAVVPAGAELILLPKVEDPQQVIDADLLIRKMEGDRSVFLMPIIESALGVERAFEIVLASDRVVALTLGVEDLTADLGCGKTSKGDEFLYARMRIVNASRAASVQPIDSVYSDLDDQDGLLAYGRASRAMGFDGMGCLHPMQIPVVHEAYAPATEEIEKARRVAAAYEEAQAAGRSVVVVGRKMVDPPVVKRALALLSRVLPEEGGES